MRPETADAIIDGLRACDPEPRNRGEMAAAARWVIYQVWHAYGDAYFDRLAGTWAETVLEGMRAHHATRIEARRIHEERQGVKQRDSKR